MELGSADGTAAFPEREKGRGTDRRAALVLVPGDRDGRASETSIRLEREGGGTLRSALDAVVHVGDTGLPLEDPGAL